MIRETTDPPFIVGMGEVLWDLLPDGRKLGGAPANFACHVAQFGYPARVVSAVGEDDLGRQIRETFRHRGIEALLETVPRPTGTVAVTLDAAGVPRYDIREEVAWDHIPFTPGIEALARRTRAVCFGSLAQRGEVSRRTIGRFLDAMPCGEGTCRIFDINLRQSFYAREVLEASFGRCDVLKINDEELDIVSRMFALPGDDAAARCRSLLAAYGLRMVILTCGAEGSHVFTPCETSFVATPCVEVADTVGAGDSFTAAFVAAHLAGRSVVEAHRLAVDVSAYVCTQHGAMPRLPETLLNRIR